MTTKIEQWIWRWHVIAGLVCLPIVLLLSITGGIYLFKDRYEANQLEVLKQVTESQSPPMSFHYQRQLAENQWDKSPTGLILPKTTREASQFISGRFSHKSSLFVDPYARKVNGIIQQNKTDMHTVRKLHGELLLGSFGTKLVELVASWMIVLILSGVYIFWPKNNQFKRLITVRIRHGKRLFYRDLHAVLGFWFSILLLLIIAGGLPWTDVFGGGFKWVHQQTNTGYPKAWSGRSFTSKENKQPLRLDEFIKKAQDLNLEGEVSISFPKSSKGVYSISNQTSQLTKMHKYHFDQYSGEQLYHGTWDNIGILMKTRLWVMAFHQGQFGLWNWILVLLTAIGLTFLSIASLLSYLKRKQNGQWSLPPQPTPFSIKPLFIGSLILMGILLPLFGLSILILFTVKQCIRKSY